MDALDSGALFSPCRRFRYVLWRRWNPAAPVCAFITGAPGRGGETTDDLDVRRCSNYAHQWGYGALHMLSIFSWQPTPVMDLRDPSAAIGPRNNEYLLQVGRAADLVVAAWGSIGRLGERGSFVQTMLERAGVSLYCLWLGDDGHPATPLGASVEAEAVLWV